MLKIIFEKSRDLVVLWSLFILPSHNFFLLSLLVSFRPLAALHTEWIRKVQFESFVSIEKTGFHSRSSWFHNINIFRIIVEQCVRSPFSRRREEVQWFIYPQTPWLRWWHLLALLPNHGPGPNGSGKGGPMKPRFSVSLVIAVLFNIWTCMYLNTIYLSLFCVNVFYVLLYGNSTWEETTAIAPRFHEIISASCHRRILAC